MCKRVSTSTGVRPATLFRDWTQGPLRGALSGGNHGAPFSRPYTRPDSQEAPAQNKSGYSYAYGGRRKRIGEGKAAFYLPTRA